MTVLMSCTQDWLVCTVMKKVFEIHWQLRICSGPI